MRSLTSRTTVPVRIRRSTVLLTIAAASIAVLTACSGVPSTVETELAPVSDIDGVYTVTLDVDDYLAVGATEEDVTSYGSVWVGTFVFEFRDGIWRYDHTAEEHEIMQPTLSGSYTLDDGAIEILWGGEYPTYANVAFDGDGALVFTDIVDDDEEFQPIAEGMFGSHPFTPTSRPVASAADASLNGVYTAHVSSEAIDALEIVDPDDGVGDWYGGDYSWTLSDGRALLQRANAAEESAASIESHSYRIDGDTFEFHWVGNADDWIRMTFEVQPDGSLVFTDLEAADAENATLLAEFFTAEPWVRVG